MTDEKVYLEMVEKFFDYDPKAATNILESMEEADAANIIQSLAPASAVRIIRHLQISYIASILKSADETFLHEVLQHLDSQLAASILMHLPNEARERMAAHISDKLKGQISEFLDYPEDSIGRIMTTDFLSFSKDLHAEEAINRIRAVSKRRAPLSYAYVIDDESHLVGVLNMRDLMIASPDSTLDAIMRKEIFSLHCFTDTQDAVMELSKRKYFAAPVVDGESRILGVIKAERLLQGVQEDVTRDIQKMFGAGGDEKVFSTIGFSLKKRLPWLHVNLATAFLAASVIAVFEGIIAKITVLAVFLPVIAGQGGNAGAQSLAVVMRGIVMREIPKGQLLQLILKEGKLGAVNGLAVGLVTAFVAWIWHGNPYLGLVIGIGMLLNMIVAGLSGASIPLLMKRIGIDPAQSSSIILTTVTDVMGFFAFLGLAVLFQDLLI